MKKQIIFLITITLLTGCGSSKQASDDSLYLDSMEAFLEKATSVSAAMEQTELSAETMSAELLAELSEMNTAFQDAAALSVPERYESCAPVTINAAAYMNQAYQCYSAALTAETPDPAAFAQAKGYYDTAMSYLSELGDTFISISQSP